MRKKAEGLQDRTKSGRPFELTEVIEYQIKKELKESTIKDGLRNRLKS
jgi:hypothetical protein